MASPLPIFDKDPSDVLDYSMDWGLWLQVNETIQATNWTAPAGLTVNSVAFTDTVSTVWLSGGTAGENYMVTCEVTTTDARTKQKSIEIRCSEQ